MLPKHVVERLHVSVKHWTCALRDERHAMGKDKSARRNMVQGFPQAQQRLAPLIGVRGGPRAMMLHERIGERHEGLHSLPLRPPWTALALPCHHPPYIVAMQLLNVQYEISTRPPFIKPGMAGYGTSYMQFQSKLNACLVGPTGDSLTDVCPFPLAGLSHPLLPSRTRLPSCRTANHRLAGWASGTCCRPTVYRRKRQQPQGPIVDSGPA